MPHPNVIKNYVKGFTVSPARDPKAKVSESEAAQRRRKALEMYRRQQRREAKKLNSDPLFDGEY